MKTRKEMLSCMGPGRWAGLSLLIFMSANLAAKGPAKQDTSKRKDTSPKYGITSGSSQVLSAVYDPSTQSLRVENVGSSSGGSSGTVTSVGLSLPSMFTVAGSPVTSSGTLTGALASQSANLVLASPSGTGGTPSFRALNIADLPAINFTNLTGAASLSQLPATLTQFTGTITAGDCAKWSSSGVVTDAGAACGSGGSSGVFQVNGANALSQTPINFQSGGYITVTNPSAGNVQFNFSGPLAPVNGGTGLTTLGANGQCLTSTGTAMAWGACGSGGGSSSIGGGVTGGTSASVLYINSSGQLAQDNANLNWNDAAKALTVGNVVINGGSTDQTLTLPTAAMTVGPGSAISIGSNIGNVPSISANGGTATPIAPINGDLGGSWTEAEVTGLHFGSTQIPIGSTAPTSGEVLGYNGTSIVPMVNGGAITVQVNATATSATTPINFESGAGITITNSSAGNISISASAVTPQNYWANNVYSNGSSGFTSNQERVSGIVLTYPVTASEITVNVATADATTTDFYSFGIFNSSGTLVAHTAPANLTATGAVTLSFVEGAVSLPAAEYYFGTTANVSTARVESSTSTPTFFTDTALTPATSGGAQPAAITPPATAWTTEGTQMQVIMHE